MRTIIAYNADCAQSRGPGRRIVRKDSAFSEGVDIAYNTARTPGAGGAPWLRAFRTALAREDLAAPIPIGVVNIAYNTLQ